MTYTELKEKDFARQIEFLNIKKYHDLGYKGKGITILNAESYPGKDEHGAMTTRVIRDYAPEVTVINSQIKGSKRDRFITVDNKNISFEEAIDILNIKLITSSLTATGNDETLSYYRDLQKQKGLIFFCAAGNYGADGIWHKWSKDNTAIAVGAAQVKENGVVERMYYSSTGDELDFMCFMGRGTGTSAASPALASMVALLLQRYGDFNQVECVEILKSIAKDLGDKNKLGWGLPILPLTDKLEILDKLRGEDMADFKDVEQDRWSKVAIDRCVAEGLIIGFEDGTFRPTEHVTREEMAQILVRILDKIK